MLQTYYWYFIFKLNIIRLFCCVLCVIPSWVVHFAFSLLDFWPARILHHVNAVLPDTRAHPVTGWSRRRGLDCECWRHRAEARPSAFEPHGAETRSLQSIHALRKHRGEWCCSQRTQQLGSGSLCARGSDEVFASDLPIDFCGWALDLQCLWCPRCWRDRSEQPAGTDTMVRICSSLEFHFCCQLSCCSGCVSEIAFWQALKDLWQTSGELWLLNFSFSLHHLEISIHASSEIASSPCSEPIVSKVCCAALLWLQARVLVALYYVLLCSTRSY